MKVEHFLNIFFLNMLIDPLIVGHYKNGFSKKKTKFPFGEIAILTYFLIHIFFHILVFYNNFASSDVLEASFELTSS